MYKLGKAREVVVSVVLCLSLILQNVAPVLAILPFLLAPTVAEAQSSAFNKEINYQGKLMDSAGSVVSDGDYNLKFRLYDAATGGTELWEESHTSTTSQVTLNSGLFSVLLGNLVDISTIDFNQDLYLSVEVGGTTTPAVWDGEMTPRKQFGAVPAAFESDKLDGLDSSQFLRSDDADTMSSTSASTLLTLTQGGSGDILNIIDGSTEVFTVVDGGNVGIGTTTPAAQLGIAGVEDQVQLMVRASSTQTANVAEFYNEDGKLGLGLESTTTAAGGPDIIFNLNEDQKIYTRDVAGTSGTFELQPVGTTRTNSLRVLPSGDPTLLDTWGYNDIKSALELFDTDPFSDNYTNYGRFVFLTSLDTNAIVSSKLGDGSIKDIAFGKYDETSLEATEFARFATTTGNFGIATSSPYAKLSVVGEVVASHFTGTTTATSTFGGNLAIDGTGTSTSAGGFDITAGCYAINGTCINGEGVLGEGTQGQVAYYDGANTVSGTSTLFITSDELVGIGTTSPVNPGFEAAFGKTLAVSGKDSDGSATVHVVGENNQDANLVLANETNWLIQNDGNASLVDADSLVFYDQTNGVRALVLQPSTGNVGLSTSSPYAKLSVAGLTVAERFDATTTGATSTFSGGFHVGEGVRFDDLVSCTAIETDGSGYLQCGTDDGGTANWQIETNYGANALTPTTSIAVWIKDALYASSTARIVATTTLESDLVVDVDTFFINASNDRVGIGTTAPDELIELAGGSFKQTPISGTLSLKTTFNTGSTDPRDIAIQGNVMYVVDADANALQVFDITNPITPVLLGSVGIGNNPTEVEAAGRYVYAVDPVDNSISIIDVTKASNPLVVNTISVSGTADDVDVQGRYLYHLEDVTHVLRIYDIADPANATSVGSLAIGSTPEFITVVGSYAYVVDSASDDLKVIDVSDPTGPIQLSSFAIGTKPEAVQVSGNYAYVIDSGSDDLRVIDISDPTSPSLSGSVSLGSEPIRHEVHGNYVYIADRTSNDFRVVDVRDPANPYVVDTLSVGSDPTHPVVSGRYAYISDRTDNRIYIVDISGIEATSAYIHAIRSGSVTVSNDISAGGNIDVMGAVHVGAGGIFSAGPISATVASTSQTDAVSGYFEGRVGIGTTAPYTALSVVGETASEKFTATSSTATSTFNGGFIVDTSALVVDHSSGNVGIGELAPTAKFHVDGTIRFEDFVTCTALETDGTGNLVCGADAGGGGGGGDDEDWNFFNESGIRLGTTTNQVLIGAGATTSLQALEVIGGGYISEDLGIGTSSPYAKLSVAGLTVAERFDATTTGATSTFSGGFHVGEGVRFDDLVSCNTIDTDASGYLTCGTDEGGTANWQIETNFGANALTPTTSIAVWVKDAFYASSTARVVATTTLESDLRVDTNTLLVDSFNNRVGIGTTTPSSELEVSGTMSFSGTLSSTTLVRYRSGTNFGPSTDDGVRLRYDNDHFGTNLDAFVIEKTDTNSGDPDGGVVFVNTGNDGVAEEALTIRGSGNVGVGTSTPESLLHIEDPGDALVVIEADGDDNDENQNPRIEFRQDGRAVIGGLGYVGDAGQIYTDSLQNALYLVNEHATSPLQFGTNDSARMTITGTGEVGIGTTSPFANLSIDLSGGEQAFAIGSSTQTVFLVDKDGNTEFGITNDVSDHIFRGRLNWNYNPTFGSNNSVFGGTGGFPTIELVKVQDGSSLIKFDTNGDSYFNGGGLAIGGTTEAGADIFLDSDGSAVFNEQQADVDFRVEGTGDTHALFVDGTNARVGIGRSTPEALLDVDQQAGDKGLLVGSSSYTTLVAHENRNVGVGTSNPYAKLSVAGLVAAERFDATTTGATSTFSGGVIVGEGVQVDYLLSCTALETDASGFIQCGTDDGGAFSNWGYDTNFAESVLTPTSTIPIWIKDAVYASSTLYVTGTTTVSQPEDSEFIRLEDTTNGDSVGIYSGTTSPEGRVSGQLGSLFLDSAGGKVYKKDSNDGGNTGWVELTGTTTHMAKMTLDTSEPVPNAESYEIAFDNEVFDVGGIANATGASSTAQFTIQRSGKYLVTTRWATGLTMDDNDTGQVKIRVNGSDFAEGRDTAGGSDNNRLYITATEVLDLAAGDKVEMFIRHTEGSHINTETTASEKPQMSVIELAGAGATGSGSSEWTDTGNVVHPSESGTDDVVIGGTTLGTADILLATTGAAVFNEQGSSADFRVEGGTETHALFVDGSSNNVGIGTDTPYAKLSVAGLTAAERFDATTTGATSTFSGGFHVGEGIRFADLTSCNTIDTDSEGYLSCGTDETGGGGGTSTSSSFSVYLSANQDSASSSAVQLVAFDTEVFDTNNDFNTSTNKFEPSIAGQYVLTATLVFNGLALNQTFYPYIFKNGATTTIGNIHANPGAISSTYRTVTAIVDANIGDVFSVRFLDADGDDDAGDFLSGGSRELTNFSGGRIDGGGGLWTDGGDTTYLATDDRVAVGTSSAAARLTVWATSTSPTVFEAVDTASNTLFTVQDDGNVGVATTSPYAKLSVAGLTVAERFDATTTGATSTFSGGFHVGEGVRFDDLTSCTALETDGNGYIQCGTDDTDAGGGTSTSSAFRVHKGGTDQGGGGGVFDNTADLVTWSTEVFDTNEDFDLANDRFLPQHAGYYILTVTVGSNNAGADESIVPVLYKNGSQLLAGTESSNHDGDDLMRNVLTAVVYSDGDDYFEVYGLANTASSLTMEGDSHVTHWSGARIDSGGGLWTDAGATTHLATDDRVAVGTSSAAAKLTVWASSTTPTVFEAVDTASNTLFTVQDDGNVGVGTTSPYAKLSVAGLTVAERFDATTTGATSTFSGGFHVGEGVRFDDLVSCNTIDTDSDGYLTCGTDESGGTFSNWQIETNFGANALTPTTTIPVWVKNALYASSTLQVVATTTLESDLRVDTSTLVVDSFNNRVGIGTSAPVSGSKLNIVSEEGIGDGTASLVIDRYTNDVAPANIDLRSANGTLATPVAANALDIVGAVRAKAFDGSQFDPVTNVQSRVQSISGGNLSGMLRFRTAATSGTMMNRMTIDEDGHVGIEQQLQRMFFKFTALALLCSEGNMLKMVTHHEGYWGLKEYMRVEPGPME